jgi:CheY-like chemotaxis protein
MSDRVLRRTKPLVLLVDDYLDTVELLADYLRFRGFEILTAADGAAAIDMAREHLPDVMILDMQLPIFTGLEVARTLKADPATSDIQIIAFTANIYEYIMEEALAAGCSSYITKPTGHEEFEGQICQVLARA